MSLFERKIRGHYLTFLEKPVREEEVAIARRLQQFVSAYNTHDIDSFMALFSDDAVVESRAKQRTPKTMDRQEFRASTLSALAFVEAIFLDDVTFVNRDSSKVSLASTLRVLFKSGGTRNDSLYLVFEKRGTKWLIVKNFYR